MAGKDKSTKDKKMAADLRARGIFHGKRMTRPYPNSGGTTMSKGPGSAAQQRLVAARRGRTP